jgi:hypothetical protein
MAKHKTVKEMMVERKPLTRKPVEPVNIYGVLPNTEETEQKQVEVLSQEPSAAATKEISIAHDDAESLRSYSTYLRQGQVKSIKLRAVELDTKDMQIVQEAIDEYFKNHPL